MKARIGRIEKTEMTQGCCMFSDKDCTEDMQEAKMAQCCSAWGNIIIMGRDERDRDGLLLLYGQ